MTASEVRGIEPEESFREIQAALQAIRKDKYALQTGLRDLDFDIDPGLLEQLGLRLPFPSIRQAEQALAARAIQPSLLIEYDQTEHAVLAFDPRPVGFSGFMDCVTHSLALTSHGLFEIGRYPGVSLSGPGKTWQWFLHRRLATPEEVHAILEQHAWSGDELLCRAYTALTGLSDNS
jgi:hypothetical protein